MGEPSPAGVDERSAFLAFYDEALPRVYAYLSARCGERALAEDLTAETFLAAVDAFRRADPPPMTVPWIIGVARHKLVDHWRRQARDDRRLHLLTQPATEAPEPWDVRLDTMEVRRTLERLGAHHRAALMLRYLDDLSVPEVANLLDRTVTATEALLVRARTAFRRAYAGEEAPDV
ncbi:MAG TPA: sigma-70 family RNA polymerase sigma factor [Acidimicrobiales bacterium]|jgi:RNA polymerase sigma-70 factor (ECF subfamily)|nr:sigma-70 family RNA polymerase sigma factor [Acidimicrobiales bacterium]